jgi:hypothetical protein
MKALNDYQTMLESNKADNISYNEKDDTLQLTSNGVGIGDKVSVKDMIGDGIPVVELGSGGTTDEDEEPMDDDSVVEF